MQLHIVYVFFLCSLCRDNNRISHFKHITAEKYYDGDSKEQIGIAI